MQRLYAASVDTGAADKVVVQQLGKEIDNTYRLYLFSLLYLHEICLYAQTLKEIKDTKFLKTTEDREFSDKLSSSAFAVSLEGNVSFQKAIAQFLVSPLLDADLVRKLFAKVSERPEYVAFLDSAEPEAERKAIRSMYKKVLLKDEGFLSAVEEHFPSWDDDKNTIINLIVGTINEFYKSGAESFEGSPIYYHPAPDRTYCETLFRKYRMSEGEFEDLYTPAFRNWDIDRINQLDLILIGMALCEMLYYPEIPKKVSINEYIEISKVYSTPKSKDFINGILDNLMKKLEEEGRITKTGRGLLEN
ncbi:transcription antitermination factor NusB [Chitinophagales bacterium]|nr:transcription antitermination factor NusB [Chitinophagales bacterium]